MRLPNSFPAAFAQLEARVQQSVTERHGAATAAQTYVTHINPRAEHLAVPAIFDSASFSTTAPTQLWLVHQTDLPAGTRVDLLAILREAINATGIKAQAGVVRDR